MERLRRAFMWLMPGMKVKRWIGVSWIGLTLLSIGLILFIKIDPLIDLEMAIGEVIRVSTQTVDLGFIFGGLFLMLLGVRQWFTTIYRAVAPDRKKELVEVMYETIQLKHGLRIVTIGGGTGLSTLLRGLKQHTSNITAVVTVADDGGSSGRLRREMGVLPPGDIRNCLVALADQENLMGDLLQYRFAEGDCLGGHSFGNLFLVALTNIAGDFDTAIKQTSKILAIKGRVIPATLSPVTLCAVMDDGNVVEGESAITEDSRTIETVYLQPDDCIPPDEVLRSIAEADIIVLGPGSLYTSVVPNLLIRGIVDAINNSGAVTVYVCNVMTQPGETDNFTAADHLKTIVKHAQGLQIDYCLVNKETPPAELLEKYKSESQFPVEANTSEILALGIQPVPTDLISADNLVRHNPQKLAERIIKLFDQGSFFKPER